MTSSFSRLRAAATSRVAPFNSTWPSVWDLLSKEGPGRPAHTVTHIEEQARPFADMDLDPEGMNGAFQSLRDELFTQTLYSTRGDAKLLPNGGWIVAPHLRLEERSVLGYWDVRSSRPGLRNYIGRVIAGRTQRIPSPIVSFRTRGETNYYHFMRDLLGGRLRLADQHGVPTDTPIIIPERLVGTSFFEDIRRLPSLEGRRWIVQRRNELVESECIYFAQTNASKQNWDHVRALLRVPDSDPRRQDRLFLTRAAGLNRTIANREEVEEVVRRYGFRVVDTGDQRLSAQMELFSNAGHVIAIHGAGLTNLVFRKNAPLSVLELFPTQVSPSWSYFFLCRIYGFDYRAIMGTNTTDDPRVPAAHRPFCVDPNVLQDRIEKMLGSD